MLHLPPFNVAVLAPFTPKQSNVSFKIIVAPRQAAAGAGRGRVAAGEATAAARDPMAAAPRHTQGHTQAWAGFTVPADCEHSF